VSARPSVSEIDRLLIKYLQSPPVQRFQAGGMSENPESDYYGGGEDDPSGPPKTQPDKTRRRNPYTGTMQKTMAYLGMLKKVMNSLGIVKQAVDIWNQPGPDQVIMNYDTDEGVDLDKIKGIGNAISTNPELAGDLTATVGAINSGVPSIGFSIGPIIDAVKSGTAIGAAIKANVQVGIPNPVTLALTYLVGKVVEQFMPDQTPFSMQKLDFMQGRGGDNEATYNKLMEAGFSGEDSLMDIFLDTVKTPQDYYEFREKYFVGDFETGTFRKDFGFDDDNFFPVEEPKHVMLGDLKIYETGNEEIDLATKELSDQFNEFKDEGYSELRILEELEVELDPEEMRWFQESDLAALAEAREAGDNEAYMRLLGGMSTTVGELADQRAYEEAAGILTEQEANEMLRKQYPDGYTQEQVDALRYANVDESVNRDDYNQYETAVKQVSGKDSSYKYSGDEEEIYNWAVKHTTNLVKAGKLKNYEEAEAYLKDIGFGDAAEFIQDITDDVFDSVYTLDEGRRDTVPEQYSQAELTELPKEEPPESVTNAVDLEKLKEATKVEDTPETGLEDPDPDLEKVKVVTTP
jgi:hypothetical protein